MSATQETESTLAGECSPTVSFSGGSKGTSVLLESFHIDRGRDFKGWSDGKGSPSAMVARHGGATSAYAAHLRPVEHRGRAA